MSAAEGRRFGLSVGAAFLALAGLFWWRGHERPALVLAGIGGALVFAGLLVPAHLGPVQSAWMKLAVLLSRVTTPIFMSVVYFIVLTPTGFLMRLFGVNPMARRGDGGSFWVERESERRRSDIQRQF